MQQHTGLMQKLFTIIFYIELFMCLHFDLVPQPKFCEKAYFRKIVSISLNFFTFKKLFLSSVSFFSVLKQKIQMLTE